MSRGRRLTWLVLLPVLGATAGRLDGQHLDRDFRADWYDARQRLDEHRGQPRDVFVLLDVSGSMRDLCPGSPWGLSHCGEAYWVVRELLSQVMTNQDHIWVGLVDQGYRLRVRGAARVNQPDVRNYFPKLSVDQGTNLYYGHHEAIGAVEGETKPGHWACILVITDGYLDEPDDPGWYRECQKYEYLDRHGRKCVGAEWDNYREAARRFGNTYGVGIGVEDGVISPGRWNGRMPPNPPTHGVVMGQLVTDKGEAIGRGKVELNSGQAGSADGPAEVIQVQDDGSFVAQVQLPEGQVAMEAAAPWRLKTKRSQPFEAGMIADFDRVVMPLNWLLIVLLICLAALPLLALLLVGAIALRKKRRTAAPAGPVKPVVRAGASILLNGQPFSASSISIGGTSGSAERLAVAGIPEGAARIVRSGGGWQLQAGSGAMVHVSHRDQRLEPGGSAALADGDWIGVTSDITGESAQILIAFSDS